MELNKIHNTDWLNNELPDKSVQLIIADPPYYKVKGEFDFIWKSFADYLADVEKWATQHVGGGAGSVDERWADCAAGAAGADTGAGLVCLGAAFWWGILFAVFGVPGVSGGAGDGGYGRSSPHN